MDPICEEIEKENEEDEKIINTNIKKNIQKNNINNIPIDYFSKSKIKLSPKEKEPIKPINLRKLNRKNNNSSIGKSKNEEKIDFIYFE